MKRNRSSMCVFVLGWSWLGLAAEEPAVAMRGLISVRVVKWRLPFAFRTPTEQTCDRAQEALSASAAPRRPAVRARRVVVPEEPADARFGVREDRLALPFAAAGSEQDKPA